MDQIKVRAGLIALADRFRSVALGPGQHAAELDLFIAACDADELAAGLGIDGGTGEAPAVPLTEGTSLDG